MTKYNFFLTKMFLSVFGIIPEDFQEIPGLENSFN